MTVQVVGADTLAASLDAAARAIAQLPDAAQASARVLLANSHPPVRTGQLAAGDKAIITGHGVQVINPVRYAPPVHNGWAGHIGRPWLHTALDRSTDELLAIHQDAAQAILDTIQGA